jgi:hypothetical protein
MLYFIQSIMYVTFYFGGRRRRRRRRGEGKGGKTW